MATSQWDSQSNLLLLQLIYKYGDPYTPSATSPAATTPVFEQIAQQLTTHSLIRPSKRKFSASLCEERYIDLLAQESLTRELSLPTTASANKKASPAVTKLAQRLYINHVSLLKSEIQALESEFLTAQKEIEEIERGDWDDKFQKQIDEQSQLPQEPAPEIAEPTVEPEAPVPAEVELEKEESPELGTKRTRAGRRKTSVTPAPAPAPAPTEPPEEENVEEIEEEPPAKRSRVATEEVQETLPPTKVEEPVEEEDVTMEEQPAEEQPVEPPQPEESTEPLESEQKSFAPQHEIIDLDEEETEEETEATKEEIHTPEPEPREQPTVSPTLGRGTSELESDAETTPSKPKQKPFSTLIHPLHASLCSLRSATLFSNPIRESDAPGYYNLILKPTDLKTLWKQVKEGLVTESVVFHREVARMFANAAMYNPENSAVWQMTQDMAKEADNLCEGYRKSENFSNGGGRGRKRKL